MSSLFISHSSRDGAAAAELRARLADWGHASVFLDFDPEAGIPPGRDWEQELYHQLRTCRAVLVLCSEHSMASHWCFAEITHAKALGKHVFPLRLDGCAINPVLAERQILDLTRDPEEAYARLERALEDSLGEGFAWDGARPPYPGLEAFQEEDAAVFFGRGREIQQGLETLERLRRYGAGRALMVLGASGSGKSSLVRAGLVPRLKRHRHWLVASAFRPLDRPWRELALSLTRTFAEHGAERDWRELWRELERAATASLPSAEPLLDAARDLRRAAGRDEARVLLVVDQAEELVTLAGAGGSGAFAALLQAALAEPHGPLMAVATLRTDLLVEFQQHPATRELEFDDLRVGPMSAEGLTEVIEAPAQVAGVDLEPDLSDTILADAESSDALPLLAFALRELYERHGEDRRLTVREYRDELGGLGGVVAKAAEDALAARRLSDERRRLFQDAMLSMVRLDEDGRFARRAVRRSDLPAEIHGVVDRFLGARLLVARDEAGERMIEVTHEVLFRSWERLRRWLDENRELLLWRKRLDAARREWERTDRHPSLLLSGPPLEESRRWLERAGARLEPDERKFLDLSLRRQAARRRRRLAAATAAALFLTATAVAGLALWRRAEAQRARAEDAARVAVAGELLDTDPTRAAQVLLAVESPESAPYALPRMQAALGHRLADLELSGHTGAVTALAFGPDGSLLASGSGDESARIWRTDGAGDPRVLGHGDRVAAVVFSPDGQRLLTVSGEDGAVRIWPLGADASPLRLPSDVAHETAVFGPRGDRVLAVAGDGSARVWEIDESSDPAPLGAADRFILRAAFAPGGDRVVGLAQDGVVLSWLAAGGGGERRILDTGGAIVFAEISPLGNRLLTLDEGGAARVWRLDGLDDPVSLAGLAGPLRMARFSPLGDRLMTATEAGRVDVWDLSRGAAGEPLRAPAGRLDDGVFDHRGEALVLVYESGTAWLWDLAAESAPEELRGHAGAVRTATFSPDGELVATAADDGRIRLWKRAAQEVSRALVGHGDVILAASFSPDGDRVLTASYDGTARIWPVEGGDPPRILPHPDRVVAASFDREGERVLTVCYDGSVRLWPADGGGEPAVIEETDGVEVAALSPDGERVATASWENRVRVWPSGGGGEPIELGSASALVVSIAFDPSGRRVATGSSDGEARIWSADGAGEPLILSGHEGEVNRVAFSPDGALLVTASDDKTARIWNTDGSGEPVVLAGHANDVVAATFDPPGDRVLTASNDFTVRVHRLEDLASPYVMSRHAERVTSATFSPSGDQVVSTSGDGTALVWRADGVGEPLVLAEAPGAGESPARVTAAAFSPDGQRVVTASEDGVARLWLVSAAALEQAIASEVSGCLRPAFRRSRLGETASEARRAWRACRSRHGR